MVRDWFEPYYLNKEYVLINDIFSIFLKIKSEGFINRKKIKY
jgi:hypothetical protein